MSQSFVGFIKNAFNRFFRKKNSSPSLSTEMQTASELWHDMYTNKSVWLGENDNKNVISLGLPSVIPAEFTRLVFSESEISVNGNGKGAEFMRDFVQDLREKFGTALAFGGMIFKPYVSNGRITADLIRADCFIPVSFTEKMMTSAVFVSQKTVGSVYYTRLEFHEYNADARTHTITNKVCKSLNSSYIGYECDFSEVPEWAGIIPEATFRNVDRPLFAYFRVPFPNDIDLDSPLGVSVYANAVNLIRQADEQWSRIEWEYESKETALDVGADMLKDDKLPKRKKRIYRRYDVDTLDGRFYNIFSPEIRDGSMFAYLNRILQRIEFNVGLAYGTLSDPQVVEKTAEEIKASKHRSYTQVSAIQQSVEAALEDLLYAVEVYASFSGDLIGSTELMCTWGDSVLEDTDKEFARRYQLAAAGKYKWEKLLAWYFGCSEEKAAEMIPETAPLFGGDTNADTGIL